VLCIFNGPHVSWGNAPNANANANNNHQQQQLTASGVTGVAAKKKLNQSTGGARRGRKISTAMQEEKVNDGATQ
jgi:hypothetical protein